MIGNKLPKAIINNNTRIKKEYRVLIKDLNKTENNITAVKASNEPRESQNNSPTHAAPKRKSFFPQDACLIEKLQQKYNKAITRPTMLGLITPES